MLLYYFVALPIVFQPELRRALEHIGETVKVVQGRSDNIKITYADDLELAKLILASQK